MHKHLYAHTYLNPNTHSHTYSLTLTCPHSHTYTRSIPQAYRLERGHSHAHAHKLIPILSAAEAAHGTERWFTERHSPALPVGGQGVPTCRKEPRLCLRLGFPPPHASLVSSRHVFMVCHLMLSPGWRARESVQSQSSQMDPQGAVSPGPPPRAQALHPSSYWGLLASSPRSSLPEHHQSRTAASASLRPLPPPLSLLGDCSRESIHKCPVSGLNSLLDISYLD